MKSNALEVAKRYLKVQEIFISSLSPAGRGLIINRGFTTEVYVYRTIRRMLLSHTKSYTTAHVTSLCTYTYSSMQCMLKEIILTTFTESKLNCSPRDRRCKSDCFALKTRETFLRTIWNKRERERDLRYTRLNLQQQEE